MSIFLTGDTHGKLERLSNTNFKKNFGREANKDDVMIILGDFGCIWNPASKWHTKETHYLDTFSEHLKGTLLVVLGNHENYDMIEALPVVERYGAECYQVRDNIFIVKNGEVAEIEGKKFFVFGGATSIDKQNREEFISWWSQEVPNCATMDKGIQAIEDNECRFDYILTHQMPIQALKELTTALERKYMRLECPVMHYLTEIHEMIDFKKWYMGHWHMNQKKGKYHCLYDDIIELKTNKVVKNQVIHI